VVEPGLVRSWQVSPDGLAWTFKLRDDVRWHNRPPVNGRPFTAVDVVWTIDYVKQGGALRSLWEGMAAVDTPDQHTLVLQLHEPQADFLGRMADHQNVVLPRELKDSFKNAAVGTGPYVLAEFRPAQEVVVRRNPDWKDLGENGRPLPYIDEIRSVYLNDYPAEVAAMRTGRVDFGSSFRKLDADALKQANPRLREFPDTIAAVYGLYLNLSRRPFDDVRVRKALALAIDAEEIIASEGGAGRQTGFLPVAIQDYAWPEQKVRERFRPDRARAAALLGEAGFPPGKLGFIIKTTNSFAQNTEVVQKQLQAVGIDARISVEADRNTVTILARGDYDAVWGNQSPNSFIVDRWLGSALRPGGSQNYFHLNDPKTTALSIAQGREMDPDRRRRIIDDLQDHLYDTMPFIPNISRTLYRFYPCHIRNMKPPSYSFNLEGITTAWIDPTGCDSNPNQ